MCSSDSEGKKEKNQHWFSVLLFPVAKIKILWPIKAVNFVLDTNRDKNKDENKSYFIFVLSFWILSFDNENICSCIFHIHVSRCIVALHRAWSYEKKSTFPSEMLPKFLPFRPTFNLSDRKSYILYCLSFSPDLI